MSLRLQLKDFQVVKRADIVISGITFIFAQNGAGKSTALKAIKTVLENSSSDYNYRHDTTSFSIIMDLDGDHLEYGRTEGTVWYKYNDDIEKTKLGHYTMAQLEPKFLLKRIDYVDARFFPNLAEQNKIPIFSDISVVDLFSTLFASMAKLSQRGIDLKKEVSKVAGSREAVGANLDFTKTKKLEFESLISSENIKYPQLEEDYTRLNEIHNKKLKFIELSQRIETLSKQYNDKNKIKMVSQVEKARGIFSQFQFVQQVSSFIDMKDRTVAQKNSLLDLYQVLPDAQYEDIVNTVGSLVVQQRALRSLQKTLLSYPSELELFPIMGEVRKLKRSINDYWVAIKAIDIEYATVEIELNEIGCPYLRQGVCPAQKEVG